MLAIAWTSVPTFVSGNVLSAAQCNILGGNLNETAAAKASAAGQYFVATGANTLVTRSLSGASNNSIKTTTSTTYITTDMPSVSVTLTTMALVFLHCYAEMGTNSEVAYYSFAVSGTSTVAGNDSRAVEVGRFTSEFSIAASGVFMIDAGLTAGSGNTFSGCVRVSGGTGTWDSRRIAVMPF